MTADHQVQSVTQIENPAAAKSSAWTVTVCFLVVLLDGLDTTSIAFVAPALTREWGISPAAFTPAFVATSIGAVVGYMACGPLAQRFGQRTVATASVLLFGLGTLLTVFADNITTLSILRFLTAIGLGGALPVAVATAADIMPPKYKEMAAMIVATGLSAGSVVGGVAGIPLMQNFGWKSVFILGGLLPLLLLPIFLSILPRAAAPAGAVSVQPENPIAALFGEGLALRTCLLWLFAFLIFLDAYALIFWVPTLLSSFGFAPSQAPIGTAAFGMGGLVGNVVMMAIVAKIGVNRMLMLTTLIAIGGIVLISQGAIPQALVLPLIGGIGAGLITGCVGQAALAVSFYPPAIRTTGVGWSSAMGRIGSIAGPAAGGLMLSLGWAPRDIVLTAVLPAIAAIATLLALAWIDRARE